MNATTVFKAHGLGNDYLVWESGPPVTPDIARRICHRHTGVGSDGILEPFTSDRADAGIRIWNPDGSIAEKSGNGLRIASWWLRTYRSLPASHTIDTGFNVVSSRIEGEHITIQMGTATFDPARIPTTEALVEFPLTLANTAVQVTAVGTGNPHAVLFFDDPDLDALPWRTWGPLLENHPQFPNRTNVQFAHVRSRNAIDIRIWERGAGETSASGSSSCGVCAAAVRTGRCDPGLITVNMPGGQLTVEVAVDYALTLRGPVAPVGRTVVDPGVLTS